MKTAHRILAITALLLIGLTLAARADDASNDVANARSSGNLKQIGLGLMMYAADNNNKLPDLSNAQNLQKALACYLKDEKVFVHPPSGEPYLTNPTLSGQELKTVKVPSDTVVVYEPNPAADGTRAVLFVDAHVERLTKRRWLQFKKISNIP